MYNQTERYVITVGGVDKTVSGGTLNRLIANNRNGIVDKLLYSARKLSRNISIRGGADEETSDDEYVDDEDDDMDTYINLRTEPPSSHPYIVNGCYGVFSIKESIIHNYNEKHNTKLSSYDDECRTIPEFIKRIEKGDDLNGNSSILSVEYISDDAWKYKAWELQEYDGIESISINNEKIMLAKSREFLQILYKILYEESDEEEDPTKTVEYIRMLAPPDALKKQDFNALLVNAQYLPKFSSGFHEAEASFAKHSI